MLRQRFKTKKVSLQINKAHICWQAIGGWKDLVRLQHSKGINPSSCAPTTRWYANFCQDAHR